MEKIKTIIVDDEPEARQGIGQLLEIDPTIEILGLCKNGIEAIDMINDHKVDLMFLDIQMPQIDGFEVVRSIPKERLPYIVFVTAYDQHALRAFEVHAIDYILKPFTDRRFQEGVNRAKLLIEQRKMSEEQHKLLSLSNDLEQKSRDNLTSVLTSGSHLAEGRLVIKESGIVRFVRLNEIIWLEAWDYYVKIHLKDRFYLVRESLKKLSERLPGKDFVRIHKSSIVHTRYIHSYRSIENGELLLTIEGDIELKVSRSYKDEISNLLG